MINKRADALKGFSSWARRIAWYPLRFALEQRLSQAILLADQPGALKALERGASPVGVAFDFDLPPLCLAASEGSASLCELLLSHGARLEERDKRGERPLIHAINNAYASVDCLVFLLKEGAAPNRLPPEPEAPLELGVATGRLKVVEALLNAGADPNGDPFGRVPLRQALRANALDIARALFRAGADEAETLAWARDENRHAQVAWLEALGLEKAVAAVAETEPPRVAKKRPGL